MDEQIKIPGTEPDPADAEDIIKRLPVVQFTMDFFRDPEEALSQWGKEKQLEEFLRKRFLRYAIKAASTSDTDIQEILNPETRTPEQQQLLYDIAAEEIQTRFYDFMHSRYMQALTSVVRLEGKYPDEIDTDPQSNYVSVKEQAVLYYFALHKEIDPKSQEKLTESQIDEIIVIFWKLDTYYYDLTGGDPYNDTVTWESFFDFIRRENPEPEAAESIITEIEAVQGITPAAHVMPNNALMNALQQKEAINAGAFDLSVAGAKGRNKEITAYTMVNYDPGDTGIMIKGAKLTEYERQVSDAIISLWVEAMQRDLRPIFTADAIYRAMPGGGEKASPQQKKSIDTTIEKFRRLHIYVDATEEAKRRGIDLQGRKYEFDEYYLEVRRHTIKMKNGGVVVQGYEILSQPVIYTYSQMTKQLLTTKPDNIIIREVDNGKILDAPIMMNAGRQSLVGYMLRRILVMRRSREEAQEKKRSYDNKKRQAANKGDEMPEMTLDDFIKEKPVILFTTMFNETGTATNDRRTAKANRDFCTAVMEYWKAQGLIKGYTLRKEGRTFTAIEVKL